MKAEIISKASPYLTSVETRYVFLSSVSCPSELLPMSQFLSIFIPRPAAYVKSSSVIPDPNIRAIVPGWRSILYLLATFLTMPSRISTVSVMNSFSNTIGS